MDVKFKFDNSSISGGSDGIKLFEKEIELHYSHIYNKTGKGSDFLGWVDLPGGTPESFLDEINEDARRIREQSEVVVVTGIGGSYLGARAVIEALGNPFKEMMLHEGEKWPHIIFAGHHLDEDYMHWLLKLLDEKDYSVIVISKSGTTTEPAVAFRLLKDHLEKKYTEKEAPQRIFAVTDAQSGALRQLADEKGYKSYIIPDDVGGRYSVLTPVGLLPIAAAGYNIKELVAGARSMEQYLRNNRELSDNPAAQYAVVRNMLYRKGKTTEILAGFNPSISYFIEWWKQLYGESEGKENKGIFPAGAGFTTDLHSLGQYIQEGLRNIFETVLTVETPAFEVTIPHDEQNLDKLNYLAGKRISFVNRMAAKGTMLAHVDGGVPNLEIVVPAMNENILGQLIYFFEMACALSGYILEVNPFDQPGVEAYKTNMFALLGKPGFEKQGEELKNRIGGQG